MPQRSLARTSLDLARLHRPARHRLSGHEDLPGIASLVVSRPRSDPFVCWRSRRTGFYMLCDFPGISQALKRERDAQANASNSDRAACSHPRAVQGSP